jgi:hypothetical protein
MKKCCKAGGMMKKLLVFLCAMLLFSGVAYAAPIQWTSGSGGNDNWYDRIEHPLLWDDAKAESESLTMTYNGMQGHLATLTSVML